MIYGGVRAFAILFVYKKPIHSFGIQVTSYKFMINRYILSVYKLQVSSYKLQVTRYMTCAYDPKRLFWKYS